MPSATVDNQSLRGFLHSVETQFPDEFLRIREPVNRSFDTTAVVFELDRVNRSPVVVFEKVGNSSMPVVTNIRGQPKVAGFVFGRGSGRSTNGIPRALSELYPLRNGFEPSVG